MDRAASAWARAQPGKIQYIAGLWGPNKDNNDQWVLYVQDTKIVFALSKDNSYKGDSDNTIAIASVPDLYTSGWRHVAAVWDAQSTAARIYVDSIIYNPTNFFGAGIQMPMKLVPKTAYQPTYARFRPPVPSVGACRGR